MDECLFCRIVKGELPSHRVAASQNFIAFLDISPISPGHTLIVPKKHATNMLDFPEFFGNELVEFSQRVAQAVVASTGAQGFNFGLNNGPAAGQAIFHTHFHIIPRDPGDGLELWHGHKSAPEELAKLREKIVAAFK
jgi:histidine triad (HIT) family protein